MSPFVIYFFISGIICFLETYYWIEINKTNEELNTMRDTINSLKNLLYIIVLLFGWILLPFEIVLIIYKNITGKSLF